MFQFSRSTILMERTAPSSNKFIIFKDTFILWRNQSQKLKNRIKLKNRGNLNKTVLETESRTGEIIFDLFKKLKMS